MSREYQVPGIVNVVRASQNHRNIQRLRGGRYLGHRRPPPRPVTRAPTPPMQKISPVSDFDRAFERKLRKLVRRETLDIEKLVRDALESYHAARKKRPEIRDQLAALARLRDCTSEYLDKKGKGVTPPASLNSTNDKRRQFVFDLHHACKTLIDQTHAHALRTLHHFQEPHHASALPSHARHQGKRISTGVNLIPQYRFEQFTAKHGPNNRIHAGQFLMNSDRPDLDVTSLDALDLYAIVKEFKHTPHQEARLEYFENPARAAKQLTLGRSGLLMLNGMLADTTGTIEHTEFNPFNGQYTSTGHFLVQSSGSEENEAIYVCDIDGDFYVHLDLSAHAGRFQHSSLVAGQQITCAGTIYIVAGRVVMMSNSSGHYQPSVLDLHDALVAMVEDLNVDPKTVLMVCISNGNRYFCSGEALLTLTANSGIESLSSAICVDWTADPSRIIRDLSADDLFRLALAETQDQQTVVSRLRHMQAAASSSVLAPAPAPVPTPVWSTARPPGTPPSLPVSTARTTNPPWTFGKKRNN
jgi:hypothetical protein